MGFPMAMWLIPPTWVSQLPMPGKPFYILQFDAWNGRIPEDEVVHFIDPDPANPYGRGSGIFRALADDFEIDKYMAEHGKSYFYNSALPQAIISPGDDMPIDPTDMMRIKQQWHQDHMGFKNAWKLKFSTRPLNVDVLDHTFKENEYVKLRLDQRERIRQVLGVPPEILGITENSNKANIIAADHLYISKVINPRLEHIRETLQRWLVPDYEENLVIDYDDILPKDEEFKKQAALQLPYSMSMNEWRDMLDLDPVKDGDVFAIPVGITFAESYQSFEDQKEQHRLEAREDQQMRFGGESGAGQGTGGDDKDEGNRTSPSASDDGKLYDVPMGPFLFMDNVRITNKILNVEEPADDEFYFMVHRVADRLQPALAREFVNTVVKERESIDPNVLIPALESLSIQGVLNLLPFERLSSNLQALYEEAFLDTSIRSGVGTAKELDELISDMQGVGSLGFTFDRTDPQAADYARSQAARLVTRVDDVNKAAIRELVARSFEEGRTYKQTANDIVDQIGLLPNQQKNLERFKQRLRDQGITGEKYQSRVEKYNLALLRKRGTVIARHELMDSSNGGQDLAWQQADEQKFIPDNARRVWIITPDERLEWKCEATPGMNENGVGMDEPFDTPAGKFHRPPMHVLCRCTTGLKFVRKDE